MQKYEHLQFSPLQNEIPRRPSNVGGGFKPQLGREKKDYASETKQKADLIVETFKESRKKFTGISNPSLIFELEINQSIDFRNIEKILASMGIHILSSAENKKGFWIVFSDDDELGMFTTKLAIYGSEDGANYDFFSAFGEMHSIPREKKIGARLEKNPLTSIQEFIDIELWRMTDKQQNIAFIDDLLATFSDRSTFRITDQLITKSFVLLRVKITKEVFDDIIELPEVSRAERPASSKIDPPTFDDIDVKDFKMFAPVDRAAGILVIDSGIVSNHPMLELCTGDESNYQTGEKHIHDTVGHGTAVAGCAAYGDIKECIDKKEFKPHNWIYSAKIMYAETNIINGQKNAIYDPERLVESQLRDAIEGYISDPEHNIRIINISIGNVNEIWKTNYDRQLPLASLIDELAYNYPNIVFIVSAGNQHPKMLSDLDSIDKIKDSYPRYLIDCPGFKLINPSTSALSLTVGSIAEPLHNLFGLFPGESIKTPIAEGFQPSPFTRSGPGINDMIKPELVEFGGNLILYNNLGRISDDNSGGLVVLDNEPSNRLFQGIMAQVFLLPKLPLLLDKLQISSHKSQRILLKLDHN